MRGKLGRILPFVFVALALLAAGYAVSKHEHDLRLILGRLGVFPLVASIVLALGGVSFTFLMWRELLHGLDAPVPVIEAAHVFFVSQLGKYLPGSVWPVLAQMEYGRRTGTGRRTMLTANALTVTLSLAAGLILAAGVLPFTSPHALQNYWWAFACLPPLLVLLHPRVIPGLLDWLFRRVGRDELNQRLRWSCVLKATGWAFGSWLLLGLHLYVLVGGVGVPGLRPAAAAIGGFALAACAGLLFIPAPAGAGVRDAVLIAALAASMDATTALALALASRVLLIGVDVLAAAIASAVRAVIGTEAAAGEQELEQLE